MNLFSWMVIAITLASTEGQIHRQKVDESKKLTCADLTLTTIRHWNLTLVNCACRSVLGYVFGGSFLLHCVLREEDMPPSGHVLPFGAG